MVLSPLFLILHYPHLGNYGCGFADEVVASAVEETHELNTL